MASTKKVGFAIVVLVALVAVVFVITDNTSRPADVDSQTIVSDDATVQSAPLAVTADAVRFANTEVAEDAPETEPVAAPEPAPFDDWSDEDKSRWYITWRLVDEFGDELGTAQLHNAGVFNGWTSTGVLAVTDNVGTTESHITLDAFSTGSSVYTTRRSPVDVKLTLGHMTFQGIATTQRPDVELRALGPIEPPGHANVMFEADRAIAIVETVDLDSHSSRVVLHSMDEPGPLTAFFAPGRYAFAAKAHGPLREPHPLFFGEFTIEGSEPKTVHVDFRNPATVLGTLVPVPKAGDTVVVRAVPTASWTSVRFAARVAGDGSFTIEGVAPGAYTWAIHRKNGDGETISAGVSGATLAENENRVTVVDAGVVGGGTLTLRVNKAGGRVHLLDEFGRLWSAYDVSTERAAIVTLPRGNYAYLARAEVPDGGMVTREGTFTIESEPLEIMIELIDDE